MIHWWLTSAFPLLLLILPITTIISVVVVKDGFYCCCCCVCVLYVSVKLLCREIWGDCPWLTQHASQDLLFEADFDVSREKLVSFQWSNSADMAFTSLLVGSVILDHLCSMTFLLKKSSDEVVMTLKELGISWDFFDLIPKKSKKKGEIPLACHTYFTNRKKKLRGFFFAPLNFLQIPRLGWSLSQLKHHHSTLVWFFETFQSDKFVPILGFDPSNLWRIILNKPKIPVTSQPKFAKCSTFVTRCDIASTLRHSFVTPRH